MKKNRNTLIDNSFFDLVLVVILLIISIQSRAMPTGYNWTQILKFETKADRLIDIMYCDHPSCSKLIGSGPKDTLNFS